MILYHLDKWKYRDNWPPQGTLHAEGRWNRPGQWLIYTSPSIAQAKLEILANETGLPVHRVCMTIEVSGDFSVLEILSGQLPQNWMSKPYPPELVNFTDDFLDSDDLLMKVPSAQSYRDFNCLINVRHPDFNLRVKLLDVSPEPFDRRLKLS